MSRQVRKKQIVNNVKPADYYGKVLVVKEQQ
jgi:hypothetical protein